MDILGWVCNNGTVSDVEAYRRSYQVNLDAIRDEMKRVKFRIHDHGYSPQKMYLLSQCFNDLSPDECNLCWSRATDLLSQCFPATGGWFHLDGKFVLRFAVGAPLTEETHVTEAWQVIQNLASKLIRNGNY